MRTTVDHRFLEVPAGKAPERLAHEDGESRLNITVLYTSEAATVAALHAAGSLAKRLNGRLTLIATEAVSYQLPLHQPPVRRDWSEARLRQLAEQSGLDTAVRFYICRDRDETLARVLAPGSLVVLGGARRWWPTKESSLARRLRRRGYEVILTETE